MSDEIRTGDIRIAIGGDEIEVLAINGEHLWGKWDSEDEPRTHRLTWAHDWTKPKPTFFEEGKSYQSAVDNVYHVYAVHEIGGMKVAVATASYNDNLGPLLLRDADFSRLTKVKLTRVK